MVDRDYDWSKFTKESLYGVPTPHDNSGTQVRDALHWLHLSQKWVPPSISNRAAWHLVITASLFRAKKAHVVSKRLDDFRERTQPQLGKVHDPIAETLDVDENHMFGVMVKADDFSESCINIVPLILAQISLYWNSMDFTCTIDHV